MDNKYRKHLIESHSFGMDFDNRYKASISMVDAYCRCWASFLCMNLCRNKKIQISILIFNTKCVCVCVDGTVGCTWFITSWWCICWNLFRWSRHWNDNDIRNESRRYTSWIEKVRFLLSFVVIYLLVVFLLLLLLFSLSLFDSFPFHSAI